jgi:hypothetical protein
MRSLPKRFKIKITVTKESKDLKTIRIEELVSFLQTYEFSLPQPKKTKTLPLELRKNFDDSSDEELHLIARKFFKYKNRYAKLTRKKKWDFRGGKDEPKWKERDLWGYKCYECSGYANVCEDCCNLKSNKEKAFQVTLSQG